MRPNSNVGFLFLILVNRRVEVLPRGLRWRSPTRGAEVKPNRNVGFSFLNKEDL
jgi:hypothetical protein